MEKVLRIGKQYNGINELKLAHLPVEVDAWAEGGEARSQRAPARNRYKWGWLTTTLIFALVFVGIVFLGRGWGQVNRQTQIEVAQVKAGTYRATNTGGPFTYIVKSYKNLYDTDEWDKKLGIIE